MQRLQTVIIAQPVYCCSSQTIALCYCTAVNIFSVACYFY